MLDVQGTPQVVRLAEHDGDLLHWFYDQGLAPGTALELRTTAPWRIAVDDGERVLDARAAEGLYVRRT